MMASDKNIVVNGEQCSQKPCSESCAPVACELCYTCLSQSQKQILFDTVAEHLNRGDTKRVVPAPIVSHSIRFINLVATKLIIIISFQNILKLLRPGELDAMSTMNRFMSRWMVAKCAADPSWCY